MATRAETGLLPLICVRHQPCLHFVGGATWSSPNRLDSGPSRVAENEAISKTIAMHTNTVVMPYPVWIHSTVGRIHAVMSRPTPAAIPNPDARALVGNTSDAKIGTAIPATWYVKITRKPAIKGCISDCALAKPMAMIPAAM